MFGPRIEADGVRWQASPVIDDAIAAFWDAWSTMQPLLDAEVANGEYGEGTERLTELTENIEPNLEWELMKGAVEPNALCLSAAADPRLRIVTQRWVDAAPPTGKGWEFHASRIAAGLDAVELAGMEIDPTAATIGIEPDSIGEVLDVLIAHPDFSGLDETLQLQAAFRFLDDLLGEDRTENWISSVDVMPGKVDWGIPFPELAQSVELLESSAAGEQWQAIEQFDPDLGNSELVINRAMKRLELLDLLFLITVSVEIPNRKDVTLADEVEQDLASTLGSDGIIFARETYGTFVVVYAYGSAQTLEGVTKLPERHGPAVYDIVTEADPSWDAYDEMR